jgi:hypothetical protein
MNTPRSSERTYADEIAEKRREAEQLRQQAEQEEDPAIREQAQFRAALLEVVCEKAEKGIENPHKVHVIEEGSQASSSQQVAAGLYEREKERVSIAGIDTMINTAGDTPLEKHYEKVEEHEEYHKEVDTNAKKKGEEKVLVSHFGQIDERNIQEAIPEAAGVGGDVDHGQKGLNIIDRVGSRAEMVRLLRNGDHQEFVDKAYERGVLKAA